MQPIKRWIMQPESEEGERIRLILNGTVRNRSFRDYVKGHDDFLDSMVSHLLHNQSLTFYDLGCGRANAANDYRGMLAQQLEENGLTHSESQQRASHSVYVGCDLATPSNVPRADRNQFFSVDLETLSTIDAPHLNFGVMCYSFPYVNDKLLALKELAKVSAPGAEILIAPFFTGQIHLGCFCHQQTQDIVRELVPEFDLSFSGDSLVLHRRDAKVEPLRATYLGSNLEGSILQGAPRGARALQVVSRYAA